MTNEELKIRIEKHKSSAIEKEFENFNNKSLEERIDYINELIRLNPGEYRKWFLILKQLSFKTIQFSNLKKFYESPAENGKKEFQTELYETINDCEWYWEKDEIVDDSDKLLKPFYNLDTNDSKLEKIREEFFQETKQDNHEYHEKLINNCSEKVIEDFKKSIEDYVLLMKNNLSKSTKKKLFSLPAYMRVYAFMKMYSTAEFWNFDDWYLIDNYDYRQMVRNIKKQQVKDQEDIIPNSKGYVKRKFPLIKPRYKNYQSI